MRGLVASPDPGLLHQHPKDHAGFAPPKLLGSNTTAHVSFTGKAYSQVRVRHRTTAVPIAFSTG